MRIPTSWRHGLAASAVCALLAAMAVNRLAPEGQNADALLHALMSLQNVTLFYWGQDRLANLIPFLLSWIAAPKLSMWAHLWIFAFSFFAFLAVLAFDGATRLHPGIAWADRWLAFLVMTAVSLVILLPHAASVLLVEGHPYMPSFVLMAVALLTLTREGAGLASTSIGLLCLFAAIGVNPSIVLVPLSLVALWLVGLKARRIALIVAAALACLAAWLALSKLAQAPPRPYFNISLASLGSDLGDALRGMSEALRPAGLWLVAGLVGAGAFAGLGAPRRAREWQAICFLGALAVGWWIAFATNQWVKDANQSHYRYFSITIFALAIAACVFLFSFVRDTGRLAKSVSGAVCAAIVLGSLWRPLVPWSRYDIIVEVEDYVDFAEREDLRFVVGAYWLAWPTAAELVRRGRPALGLSWRAQGNRAAIVAAIEASLRMGKTPRALCIEWAAADCIVPATEVSGFTWVETSRACPVDRCLVIEVSAFASPPRAN
jgi:hypothetical protein